MKRNDGTNAKKILEEAERHHEKTGQRLQAMELQLAALTQMFSKFVVGIQNALPASVQDVSEMMHATELMKKFVKP